MVFARVCFRGVQGTLLAYFVKASKPQAAGNGSCTKPNVGVGRLFRYSS